MEQISKFKLLNRISLENPIENYNFFFLVNYKEIETLLYQKNEDIMKLFYFNKKNIHQILYNSDEIVNITSKIFKERLCDYFYLILLISDDKYIVNYKYSFDFINELNNFNKKNNYHLDSLLYSKIIIDLINNYKDFCEEEESYKDQICELEKFNKNMIEQNIENIKKYNLNIDLNIFKKNIDDIYVQIINQLISNINNDNFEFIYDMISKIDLENIDLNSMMFREICEVLNNNINDKIISNIKDLEKKDKINFYFFLQKYILKNSVYIYQIPFLLQTRKNILNIIKLHDKILLNNDFYFNEYKDRLYYIIKSITDSEYYFKRFKSILHFCQKEEKTNKNNNNNKNNNDNIKKINIKENEKKEKNNPTESRTLYSLEDLENNIINNNKESIKQNFVINYNLNAKLDYNKELIKQYNKELINEIAKINFQKIFNFLKKFHEIIQRKFKNNINLEIELEFQKEEDINNNDIDNFTCIYKLKNLNTTYKDQNIFINGLSQGFQTLIYDIEYEL